MEIIYNGKVKHAPSAFPRISSLGRPPKPIVIVSGHKAEISSESKRQGYQPHLISKTYLAPGTSVKSIEGGLRRATSLPCPPKSTFSHPCQLDKFPPPPPMAKFPNNEKRYIGNAQRQKSINGNFGEQNQHTRLEEEDEEDEGDSDEPPDFPDYPPRGRMPIRVIRPPAVIPPPSASHKSHSKNRNKLVERKHVTISPYPRRSSRSPSIPRITAIGAVTVSKIRSTSCITISESKMVLGARASGPSHLLRPLPMPPSSGHHILNTSNPPHRSFGGNYYYPFSSSCSLSRPRSPRPRPSSSLSATRHSFSRSSSSPSLMSSHTQLSPVHYSINASPHRRALSPPFSSIRQSFKARVQLESAPPAAPSDTIPLTQRPLILPTQPIVGLRRLVRHK